MIRRFSPFYGLVLLLAVGISVRADIITGAGWTQVPNQIPGQPPGTPDSLDRTLSFGPLFDFFGNPVAGERSFQTADPPFGGGYLVNFWFTTKDDAHATVPTQTGPVPPVLANVIVALNTSIPAVRQNDLSYIQPLSGGLMFITSLDGSTTYLNILTIAGNSIQNLPGQGPALTIDPNSSQLTDFSSDFGTLDFGGAGVLTMTLPNFTGDFSQVDGEGFLNGFTASDTGNVLLGPQQVPEPGSLFLLGAVAAGAAGYRWRRRKAPVALPA
jgi:hypothetical protein